MRCGLALLVDRHSHNKIDRVVDNPHDGTENLQDSIIIAIATSVTRFFFWVKGESPRLGKEKNTRNCHWVC